MVGKDFKVSPWQWQELCWLWCEVQAWLQYPEACLQSIIYSWYDELHQIVLQAKGYNYDFNIQRHVCSQLYIHDMMSYAKLYYKQKDTTMTSISISKGMFASNYDEKSWQQIVSQGKNLRLNWFAKLIDPRLNKRITGKSEQPAVYPNWHVRCI